LKSVHKLTVKQIDALKSPGRYSDGGNLYISVSETGTKAWTFVFRFHARTREAGLGRYPDVSLKAARDKAAEGRAMLNQKPKVDPLAAWQAEAKARNKPTFKEAAEAFVDARQSRWRNDVHRSQWRTTLALDVPRNPRLKGREFCKSLLALPVDEITTDDILKVLRPVWSRTPETGTRIRNRIELVLSAAQAEGHIPGDRLNPARWRGHLDRLLPPRQAIDRGNHRALDYELAPAFMTALRARRIGKDGSISVGAYAFEFCILTATRTNETLGARWSEIDLSKQLWRLPKERMKAGRAFEVPLSNGALAILAEMLEIRCDDLIFSRGDNWRLGDQTFIKLLRSMKAETTAHGWRSTFRDWAGNETSFPHDVCEHALAHQVGGKVERAYRRQSALEKRRDLMAAWDRYLAGSPSADVIDLKRAS
jgi:integrase